MPFSMLVPMMSDVWVSLQFGIQLAHVEMEVLGNPHRKQCKHNTKLGLWIKNEFDLEVGLKCAELSRQLPPSQMHA